MGRGSDTRMYSPRSESTRMFGYDEDEGDIGHAHGYGDPELAAEERENKKRKKEDAKQRQKLHHLKVKHKDILDELPPSMGEVLQEGDNELPPKDEEQNELSALTGASGSRGALVDQAIGAKTGTGSALGGTPPLLGPMGVYHSEPMESAWSDLLKEGEAYPEPEMGMTKTQLDGLMDAITTATSGHPNMPAFQEAGFPEDRFEEFFGPELAGIAEAASRAAREGIARIEEEQEHPTNLSVPYVAPSEEGSFPASIPESSQLKWASEPIDSAWSELMKAKKDKHEGPIAGGEIGTAGTTTERRKEHAKKWAQPKFPIAPGGRRPWTATSRRSKARSRTLAPRHRVHSIKGGLMQQPLAVHMSHLGVQTKQPLRQFPEKYRQYYGQQLRRRLTGNIAQTVAPHGLFGERSQFPGATGGGRLPGLLPGQAAAGGMPSLRRLARPRMPRLKRPTGFSAMTPPTVPSAPSLPQPAQVGLPSSSIQMSGKVGVGSPLKKNLDILRPGTFAFMHSREIALLLRQLKEQLERRERTRKGKGTADVSGAGDTKPHSPANSPKKTTRPQGATETDPDDDPRYWGMEPSAIVGNH
jgi:hypothetical protein